LRKDLGGIRDLARSIGHGGYEFAVDVANRQQERTANGESENAAEGAATREPVVHDHQPADADHRAPTEREVVGDPELAGELRGVNGICGLRRGRVSLLLEPQRLTVSPKDSHEKRLSLRSRVPFATFAVKGFCF
jgi:hypothetical protein